MGDYRLIETPEALEELAQSLRRDRVIGVDTEADSFFHYVDKLCLMQIACKSGIFLVDPLKLKENGGSLEPLAPILANPEVRKIFHAADYDLYVLQRHGGMRVRNIFDTMISAQLLGYPAVGLSALVEQHFGIKLSKDQQRTDWSKRALSPVQLEYAASDVHYLIELASIIEKELRAKKRREWARQEFALLEEKVWPERQFDKQGYLRIKGAKKLSPRSLAVLRELFLVRDKRARHMDKPPFKVLGNGTLLELALNPPQGKRALGKRKGVTDLVLRRHGNEILEGVQRGLDGPEHPPLERRPQGGARRRLDRRGESRLDQLKRWRTVRSKELGMDPGVLCPNAVLEEIAWANPKSLDQLEKVEALRGWRLEAIGKEALAVLARARGAASAGEKPAGRPQAYKPPSKKRAPSRG
ncbi:MAG: ribonuclease D [Deltaproteobacteria bacterium]|nr:ribonuclease D [Deltaproteobacteria bacterium]